MSERRKLHLASGWALGWDETQWILFRARKAHAETRWMPVSYIATTKGILLRCMRENGVQADRRGLQALATLPEQFEDWRRVCREVS